MLINTEKVSISAYALLAFLDVMGPRDGVVDGPLVDGVKVPARMQRAEVGPEVALLIPVLGILAEGEDANVRRAHEIDTDGLDAVIWKEPWNISLCCLGMNDRR